MKVGVVEDVPECKVMYQISVHRKFQVEIHPPVSTTRGINLYFRHSPIENAEYLTGIDIQENSR
jgi:hypothetical protein